MGSCILSSQGSHKQDLPKVAAKYIDYYQKPHKKNSTTSLNTNPEELIRKQSEQSCKKREETTSPSSDTKPSDSPSSFITLSQLLEGQNEDMLIQQSAISYKSSIIRLPRRNSKECEEQRGDKKYDVRSQILSQVQNEQNLDAKMNELDDYAKLSIKLQKMEFQFNLPKCRAGPLVVPQVIYSMYEV